MCNRGTLVLVEGWAAGLAVLALFALSIMASAAFLSWIRRAAA
jgi:hypothetical protein